MSQKLSSGHLFGKTLRCHEVAGFVLTEAMYPPGLKLPHHSHEYAGLCFVLQGTLQRSYSQRRTEECGPASVSFHPADELHAERFDNAGVRLFSLQIAPRWLEHVRDHSVILDNSASFRGGLLVQLATRLYQEALRMDAVSPLVIEGLALEMLAELSRRSVLPLERRPVARWLEQVREIINTQFSEPLTLSQIAKSVNIHPVHIARTFRKHHRCTIGEYVRRLRIEFACRQLSTSNTPLAEIALQAGFSSQSHFSTTFRLITGLTPAQYRSTFRLR